jgi:FkbM family methyltransferase
MIERLADIMETPTRDCIYDILGYMPLGHCVDIGAAAGESTRRLCEKGAKRITAFEPFPGNHPHFVRETEGLQAEITLVKKAVSDRVAALSFVVPSVVGGTEPGWAEYEGYSSVGFLTSASRFKALAYQAHGVLCSLLKRPHARTYQVESTTIDAELQDADINFMKIDVQGAEASVLDGGRSALSEGRVHVLYIEWSGEQGVISKLKKHGYTLYDSTYVVCAKPYSNSIYEELGFKCIGETTLSTGKTAQELALTTSGLRPERALAELKTRISGWMQTDLIAISPSALAPFQVAVQKYQSNLV